MDQFKMRKPIDCHLHLRNGDVLRTVLPFTVKQFKRAVIMPNTEPPVLTGWDAFTYREEILAAANGSRFKPLMTIQIVEGTKPETIAKAKEAGVVAGKVYPRGLTTNSENGVSDYRKIYPALAAMEECGMLALFHGEMQDPNGLCLDWESKFFPTLKDIAKSFRCLKIVMEHITTARAVDCIDQMGDNVAATITVHHLLITLDDVVGGKLQPHHFCKPIAKRPQDRAALVTAAMSGRKQFFLGTDSAPHLKAKKECASGCAGIFTAPVALPLLVELFEQHAALSGLEDFCSNFGADFYGLPRNGENISFVRKKWKVPPAYGGIVPFWAGKEISWQVE